MHRAGLISAFLLLTFALPATARAQTPNPPSNLIAVVETRLPSDLVRLMWEAPQGPIPATGYIVEIGTAPGGTNVLVQEIGAGATVFTSSLSPGSYFARVRALNGSAASTPSNEVTFALQCHPRPGAAAASVSWRPLDGNRVQVVWDGVIPVTSWLIDVTNPSGTVTNFFAQPGSQRSIALTLASGQYIVYIRGVVPDNCGVAYAADPISITVGEPAGTSAVVINEFDGFVELRNTSNAPVDVSGWWLLAAPTTDYNVVRSATLPPSTTIAANCTYLLAPSSTIFGVTADLLMTRTGAGYAVVNTAGRIQDSVAYQATAPGASTPLGEGALLPPISSGSYARRSSQDTNNNITDFAHAATPTPANASACRAESTPGAPQNLVSGVSFRTVTLSWQPPTTGGIPSAYLIEAGFSPGAADATSIQVNGLTTSLTVVGVPDGVFYVRVRAVNAIGASPPSNEAIIVMCTNSCTPAPGPVLDLAYQVNGRDVTLTWRVTPPVRGFVIEVGSATGVTDIGRFPIGFAASTVTAVGVPPGTYFVRVRGVNGTVVGPPSNEVVIVVP